jgi:hypothetical protein
MPRYFFHVTDGYSTRDTEGTELRDIYTAQDQAIRTSGEILREMGAKFWDGTDWTMEVADEQGQILLMLRFSAEEHLASTNPSSDPGSA